MRAISRCTCSAQRHNRTRLSRSRERAEKTLKTGTTWGTCSGGASAGLTGRRGGLEAKFGAVVVGAGFAGCAAAIRLAKAGATGLLIGRAEKPGQKNMTGGV